MGPYRSNFRSGSKFGGGGGVASPVVDDEPDKNYSVLKHTHARARSTPTKKKLARGLPSPVGPVPH